MSLSNHLNLYFIVIVIYFRILLGLAASENRQSPSDLTANQFEPINENGSPNHINSQNGDQRPLYNIAHMCNSIKKTSISLSRGANAVEVDVTFKFDDIYLYHGSPCDCFRYCWNIEPLSKYLVFARKVTTPGYKRYEPNFAILYFDVKLKPFSAEQKYAQGIRFANHLAKYFFNEEPIQSTLRLVVSISYTKDVHFLRALMRRLKELNLYSYINDRIGFDVGMDTNSANIRNMWSKLNVSNIWRGEGISNCFNPIVGHQLEMLVRERDSNSYPQKVYRWTIDLTESIKTALRFGVDGIMTNHPERVVKILQEEEFAKSFRLATIYDNPFLRYHSLSSPDWNPSTVKSSKENISTFFQDIKESLYNFISEIFSSLT